MCYGVHALGEKQLNNGTTIQLQGSGLYSIQTGMELMAFWYGVMKWTVFISDLILFM